MLGHEWLGYLPLEGRQNWSWGHQDQQIQQGCQNAYQKQARVGFLSRPLPGQHISALQ